MTNLVLRARVELDLERKYSPEQIAGRLRGDYPDDAEMWVSTETIYQSLYVQSRGALRRELAKCLRTGRGLRQPNRQGAHRKSRVLPDMINIASRPAEADDRADARDSIAGSASRPELALIYGDGCAFFVRRPIRLRSTAINRE